MDQEAINSLMWDNMPQWRKDQLAEENESQENHTGRVAKILNALAEISSLDEGSEAQVIAQKAIRIWDASFRR